MQDKFARALLDHSIDLAETVNATASFSRDARIDIHRNTVMSSLAEALRATFPVLEQLIGAEPFNSLAVQFVRAHPPQSPYLFEYGSGFPEYIASRTELARYPFLADVATLELQLLRSTHAADSTPVTAELATLASAPERLASSRFRFSPSVALMQLRHCAAKIWLAHQQANPKLEDIDPLQPEWIMVSRPQFTYRIEWLNQPEFNFLLALQEGRSVEEAIVAAGGSFDLTGCFQRLVQQRVIVAIESL